MNKKRIEHLEDQHQGGKSELIFLLNQFRDAMDKKDYKEALEIREQAEPIFQANSNFLTTVSPDGKRDYWTWFLVFICDESREHLIESLQNDTKPEYRKLYLPFNQLNDINYHVKFF